MNDSKYIVYPTAKQLVESGFTISPDPHDPVRTSCAVCNKCWMNPKTGVCLYGGPFTGYYQPSEDSLEKLLTLI